MGTFLKSQTDIVHSIMDYRVVAILLTLGLTAASCPSGRWGETACNNICGHCTESTCNSVTGVCNTCEQGWRGSLCDQAICDEASCENLGGHCVAPDICACPSADVNTVAKVIEDEHNINGEGVRIVCDNLKVSGIRGALVGFAILTASL